MYFLVFLVILSLFMVANQFFCLILPLIFYGLWMNGAFHSGLLFILFFVHLLLSLHWDGLQAHTCKGSSADSCLEHRLKWMEGPLKSKKNQNFSWSPGEKNHVPLSSVLFFFFKKKKLNISVSFQLSNEFRTRKSIFLSSYSFLFAMIPWCKLKFSEA